MSKTLCSPLRLQDHRSDSTTACGRRECIAGFHSLHPYFLCQLTSLSFSHGDLVVGIQKRKGHACSPPSQTPTDGWRVRSGRRGAFPPPKFDPTKDRYVRFFSSTPLISSSTISSRSIRVSSSPAMVPSTAALLRRRILAEKLGARCAVIGIAIALWSSPRDWTPSSVYTQPGDLADLDDGGWNGQHGVIPRANLVESAGRSLVYSVLETPTNT